MVKSEKHRSMFVLFLSVMKIDNNLPPFVLFIFFFFLWREKKIVTKGHKNLQQVKKSKGLQMVTNALKRSQKVTNGHKMSQKLTKGHKSSQKVSKGHKRYKRS